MDKIQEISIKLLIWFGILMWPAIILIALFVPVIANADNEIYVTQTGDNLRLEWQQKGDNNLINTVLSGYQLDTAIHQEGKRNQVLKKSQGIVGDYNQVVVEQWNNSTSTDYNRIWIDIDGDNNGVDVGQGCKFYYSTSTTCSRDTHEQAGHNMEINIDGSNNGIRGGQKAGSANPDHDLVMDINGDNNGVFFTQAGSGSKDLDLTIKPVAAIFMKDYAYEDRSKISGDILVMDDFLNEDINNKYNTLMKSLIPQNKDPEGISFSELIKKIKGVTVLNLKKGEGFINK